MRKYFLFIAIAAVAIITVALSFINGIKLEQLDDIGTVKITVNFFLPVVQEGFEDKINLVSERPGTDIIKDIRWVNPSTLEIFALEEGIPKGFNTTLKITGLKTKIPGVCKYVKYRYRADIEPFLAGLSPVAPSTGPIVMSFSTSVSRKEIQKHLKTGFQYELAAVYTPLTDEGRFYLDQSQWQLFPREKLTPGGLYDLIYEGGGNGKSEIAGFHKVFKVAPIPKIVSSEPRSGENEVLLYTPISVDFDEDMKEVFIDVEGMKGDIELTGKRAVYKPHSVYIPGKEYDVKVRGRSIFGEIMPPQSFKFLTVDMGDKYWVEINLRPLQKLVVYKGKQPFRTMVVSAGLPEPENATPRGLFLLKDRGERFFTPRIAEGGLFWVRIVDNWLIHSMPRNPDDEIIPEEFIKHGIPASHGCVRLKDDEAKWFFDNIPMGTPCYIHD